MKKSRFTEEQIAFALRQVDVLASQGKSVSEISREIGVSENTYYRWRKEYVGLWNVQAVLAA